MTEISDEALEAAAREFMEPYLRREGLRPPKEGVIDFEVAAIDREEKCMERIARVVDAAIIRSIIEDDAIDVAAIMEAVAAESVRTRAFRQCGPRPSSALSGAYKTPLKNSEKLAYSMMMRSSSQNDRPIIAVFRAADRNN